VKQRMHALTQLFRRDCGPLRRPVDRAEAVALTVLIATFAVAWLALAIVTGRWAYDAGVQQQRAEQGWHKTTATLLESAAQAAASSSEWGVAWVPAHWAGPNGRQVQGNIATELNVHAGEHVQIWVNAAGKQTRPPLTSGGVHDQVVFTIFSVTMGMAIALTAAAGCMRLLFNRKRMTGWQHAWEAVGPIWSRHA